ncbi:MAG: FAD:protein FMN transferase [Candidatus Nanopelagicaceae bacterium]|nr:FAD:protein FMN transferase [Candidatus Nanopelagicaceae bacterium]
MAHLRSEIEVWGTILFVDASSGRVDESSLQEGMDALGKFVSHVDDLFSTYKDDSVISQLRRKEIQIEEAPEEVREVWDRCIEARDLTEGAFDPWAVAGGFDPSGLVKGWAADKCAQILQEAGAEHIQINAAGDLSLRGGFFDGTDIKPWSIGVVNPENRQEVVQVFEIMDGAIATSGTYERGAHILDPHSNLIAIGARSATVIGPDGGMADALATALMVEGRDGAIWFSQPELSQYSAWVVDRHADIAWSVGPESPKG